MARQNQHDPLKTELRRRGFRNMDLARRTGCSPATMSRRLRGGRLPELMRDAVLESAAWDGDDLLLILSANEAQEERLAFLEYAARDRGEV